MAVKLRLKRIGRAHRAIFRLAAMDERSPRDGRVLEELGLYDPANQNPAAQLQLRLDRVQHWISQGAVPSDTVRQLIRRASAPTA